MSVRVQVKNTERLAKRFLALPEKQQTQIAKAIQLSALEVQGTAQRNIQRGARSGVIVTRGGKAHQRSAPGEYPKTDTGRLVSSIFAELSANRLSAIVGTDVDYGTYLEFGTQGMGARPWLQRTFESLKKRIRDRIQKAAAAANAQATKQG